MKILTAYEVAERLQISVRQVRHYTATGAIKVIKFGRSVRISEDALTDFISAQTAK